MRRLSSELPFTCVTCEALIRNRPTFHVGLPFCCAGCVAGGPCTCSYDPDEPGDTEATVRHCLDVADGIPLSSGRQRELVAPGRR